MKRRGFGEMPNFDHYHAYDGYNKLVIPLSGSIKLLYRLVFVSKAVGETGQSTQSLAHILGAAERNNRRDELSGALMFHGDEIVQIVEGARADLDRLMRRVGADPRHRDVVVVEDRPVMQRRYRDPMRLCQTDHRCVANHSGGRRLREMSAMELERLMSACSLQAA
ncbi:BLUF domain-containing protein [Brevundimonas sp.]|uniref:BLUF domain-containing protein n=1 Tax=Brevundimonas sp. TaxID=1871086 RepID=UPI0025B84999|nr:BLUF domain-containing protein [Brevundimonas sp.]